MTTFNLSECAISALRICLSHCVQLEVTKMWNRDRWTLDWKNGGFFCSWWLCKFCLVQLKPFRWTLKYGGHEQPTVESFNMLWSTTNLIKLVKSGLKIKWLLSKHRKNQRTNSSVCLYRKKTVDHLFSTFGKSLLRWFQCDESWNKKWPKFSKRCPLVATTHFT